MRLLYQTHSPFARKVLVLAYETGLAGRLEVIHHETSPTQRNEAVFQVNPLGKVPVLVLDDGTALFDSHVICEYLDDLHDGPRIIPTDKKARWRSLAWQALAQGMCEAGIIVRHETVRRPAPYRYPAMRDGQIEKLLASYDYLEHALFQHDASESAVGAADLGSIAVATALSWLAFRDLPAFEPGRPHLSTWYRDFMQRPSMRATPLEGETVD